MSVHGPHGTIVIHGLHDGCERCEEMARDPWTALDDRNLAALVERTIAWTKDQEFPRSENEKLAMRDVERTLVKVRRLRQIGIEVAL